MRRLLFAFLVLIWVCPAQAQTTQIVADCSLRIVQQPVVVAGVTALTSVGTSALFDNRGAGCVNWTLVYSSYGFSAATIEVVDAQNNFESPATPVAFQGTITTAGITFPTSAGSSGTISMTGYYPYMGVSLVSKTGTGRVEGVLYGWKAGAFSSNIAGLCITGQPATNGEVPIGNTSTGCLQLATLTAGSNVSITNGAGSITISQTDTSGIIAVNGTANQITAAANTPTSGTTTLSLPSPLTFPGQTFIVNGTVGGPGLALSASQTTGLYRVGADILGIATAGTQAVKWDASQNMTFAAQVFAPGAGTASAPSYSAGAYTNSGMYFTGSQVVNIATNGTKAVQWDANQNQTNAGYIIVPGGTSPLMQSSSAWTTGAGSSAGTLLNAPSAGNPTKWIPINDNGTTRYIPAW